jgi:hypothetical protein
MLGAPQAPALFVDHPMVPPAEQDQIRQDRWPT